MAITSMDKIIPIVDAMQAHIEQYDSGDADYSVTEILDPPRIVHLNKRHYHKVPFEIDRNLASYMGTAIHDYTEKMLRKKHPELYVLEERLSKTVLGRKISGAYDILYLPNENMYDIKTSKPQNLIFNDRKKWTEQQNIYRLLLKENKGIKVKKLNIIFWSWIWEKYKMMQNKAYPRARIIEIKLPVWSYKRTAEFLKERVQLMIDHENIRDAQLPYCTEYDYWGDPDKFAVHRHDRKNALRLLPTQDAAFAWMQNYCDEAELPISKFFIQCRPAERKRCDQGWCRIRKWCNQYTEYLSMKGGKT